MFSQPFRTGGKKRVVSITSTVVPSEPYLTLARSRNSICNLRHRHHGSAPFCCFAGIVLSSAGLLVVVIVVVVIVIAIYQIDYIPFLPSLLLPSLFLSSFLLLINLLPAMKENSVSRAY